MNLYRLGIILAAAAASPLAAAESPAAPPPVLTYADLADLAVPAPVTARVRVTQAIKLDPAKAAVPAGVARYYVEADVVTLIRSSDPIPAHVSYLADIPAGERLRKKSEFIIFARPVPQRPAELQLIAPDAQIPWSEATGERARAILTEAAALKAPPRITGIGHAFHVAGTLPGEGETQIFLVTAGGQPVSLNILRRPGQQPHWAVAMGEIVDESATTPRPDTLLWYRLACGLPSALPQKSVTDASPDDAQAIRADYQLVLESLGRCERHRSAA